MRRAQLPFLLPCCSRHKPDLSFQEFCELTVKHGWLENGPGETFKPWKSATNQMFLLFVPSWFINTPSKTPEPSTYGSACVIKKPNDFGQVTQLL